MVHLSVLWAKKLFKSDEYFGFGLNKVFRLQCSVVSKFVAFMKPAPRFVLKPENSHLTPKHRDPQAALTE
jgi:hypothetical protein